jgi:hypothetical protein
MKDKWINTNNRLPKEFETVLTQHIDDLYPVAAYLYDKKENIWIREIEGPEGETIKGKNEELYRTPTHWRPLPEKPSSYKTDILEEVNTNLSIPCTICGEDNHNAVEHEQEEREEL